MELKKLSDNFSVSAQISAVSVQEAAENGFTMIINARPDGEEDGQLESNELAQASADSGLAYVHIPVIPGQIDDEHVMAFAEALDASAGPVLGFCRTGTRAVHLWALSSAARQSVAEIIESASEAGYDIADLIPRLEALSDS